MEQVRVEHLDHLGLIASVIKDDHTAVTEVDSCGHLAGLCLKVALFVIASSLNGYLNL